MRVWERAHAFNTAHKIDEKRFVASEWTNGTTAITKKQKNEEIEKKVKLGSLCVCVSVCVSFWKQRKCQIECETKRFQNGHNQIGKNYIHTYPYIHMEWAKKINNNNNSSSNHRCRGRWTCQCMKFRVHDFSFARSLSRSLALHFAVFALQI